MENYKDIEDFFNEAYNSDEIAWTIIHDFEHHILTYAEENNISNYMIKKMNNDTSSTIKDLVEIADTLGLEIELKLKNK